LAVQFLLCTWNSRIMLTAAQRSSRYSEKHLISKIPGGETGYTYVRVIFTLLAMCARAACRRAETIRRRTVRLVFTISSAAAWTSSGGILARQLTENLGKQVIVDNRRAASGVIGTENSRKSAADGFIRCGSTPSRRTNQFLMPRAVRPVTGFRAHLDGDLLAVAGSRCIRRCRCTRLST